MKRLQAIPFDDRKTFELLSTGHTVGLFQIESPFAAGVVKQIQPSSLQEICAIEALLRPGSTDSKSDREFAKRKRSGWRTPSIHPELNGVLEPILWETYGLIVYQEQVMKLISVVTGMTDAESDDIFYAMRKKDVQKMAKAKPSFMEAGSSQGYSQTSLEALWEVLVPFSDYSFNKAHSMGYAYITYWTAYLKANYPKEYMSALLSSAKPEDISRYLAEVERMGIPLLPPDINDSGMGFTCTKKGIRYGLGAIKGLGEPTTKAIVAGRPFRSLDGFFRNADPKVLNARVLSALVKTGSLDSLWASREELLEQAPELAALALRARGDRSGGQGSLIRTRYIPRTQAEGSPPQDSERRAADERELLGAVLTHPGITLTASRPLSESEWMWLRQVLLNGKPIQEVTLKLGNTTMKLPKTTYTPQLWTTLALVGIRTEEA